MADLPADLPDDLAIVEGLSPDERAVADDAAEAERAQARAAFLELARKRFRMVASVESELRQKMLDDFEFLIPGNHWPEDVKEDRRVDGRPCLEVDRLTQPIKQVTNSQRQLRPSIQINPVDSGADPKTAEAIQGLCRHIEVRSDADVAYDTAGEHQAKAGRGYWRILTEYIDDTSFAQEIRIKRIRNPFSVYLDPTALEADGSDARWGFLVKDLTREEWDAQYRDTFGDAASLVEFTGVGNEERADWYPEGRIRIAEYFYREDRTYLRVEDPQLGMAEVALEAADTIPPGFRKRRVTEPRVYWATINARDVLDGNEEQTGGRSWPGKFIPIVPVYGDESDLNGVVDYQGIVRRSRDTQRISDYWKSAITETIALAPRAPFIGYEGQFEGHEGEWALANRRNFPYLQVKPISLAGSLAPLPQRQAYEPPIQAMSAALAQNENDLRAVTGYVDVQAAENRSETSGRAILARQKQAELGNSNYIDNLGRAIRHTGRILLDLIPKIYDVPRVVRILGLDEQPRTVLVGSRGMPQPPGLGQPPQALPPGVEGMFDLSVGRYDVTVTVGPSHQSKRQESVDAMLQFLQAAPTVFPIIGDLLARNMDWPGADQIADRLKKMLPPQLQEAPQGQDIPPQVQAQLAQMDQMIQQLTEALKAQTTELEGRKLEMASKERIAQIQADTQMAIAQSKAVSAEQIALLEAKMAQVEQLVAIDMARLSGQQSMAAAEAQRQYEADQAQQGRQHDASMAAMAAANQQAQAEAQTRAAGEAAQA